MSVSRTLPNPAIQDVDSYDILIENEPLSPAIQVLSISINNEVNRIPSAMVVIRDGEAADSNFELSEGDQFLPGNLISIKLGRDSENKEVFKGIVTKQSVKIQNNGDSNLIVQCYDEAIKMSVGRKNRYFENRRDSEIIEELIQNYPNLSAEIEATDYQHPEMVQHHCTDWDMMVSRAELNGKMVVVDRGKIYVVAPDTEQDPTIDLLYGSTIYAYSAELDSCNQWANVQASAWDYASQDLIQRESNAVDFNEAGNLSSQDLSDVIGLESFELRHSGQVRQEELQAWSDACLLKSRLAKIRGRAQILVGNSDLKPNTTVNIQGVGQLFSGKVYVTGVKQEMHGGKWDTHIQFGLKSEWFANRDNIFDFPAAGIIPPVNGLQIGIVHQLENDPDGEDRIQVKIPVIDAAGAGIWCRVSCPDAGENRGVFWRPEIGDEVIVGFLNDDPRDAVVLGCLHSSAKHSPISAQDNNHEKGIITREQMKLHFKEDTKTITIETPGGNSIVLDESGMSITITDQNSNTIKMSSSGIDIESQMTINIKAGMALNLSAGTTLGLSAPSLSMSGDASVSISGATTTISAQGANVISGFPVNIN